MTAFSGEEAWTRRLVVATAMLISSFPPEARPLGGDPEVYRHCAGQERLQSLVDIGWAPVSSALEDHKALRTKLGAVLPQGSTRVLWYGAGGDLTTKKFSVVAVRRATGVWHLDGLGENQIWIKDAPPTALPRLDRDLDVGESRQLDAMIADRCLIQGPTMLRDPRIIAGAMGMTVEVETPQRRWVGSWMGASTVQESALVALIDY